MLPSGPSTPMGGPQPVPSSLLRSNAGMMGAQGGSLPSQPAFPSLVSPRAQFNNMNMLGNISNVSSLLNQSYGNGVPSSGISGPGGSQRVGMDAGAESDSLSSIGNGMGINAPTSFVPSNMANPGSSAQVPNQQFASFSGNQVLSEPQQSQHLEGQNSQHGQQQMQPFSASHGTQQPLSQQHLQSLRGGLGGAGQVKLEHQVTNDQHGQQPQLQALRNLAPVKLEPQQFQNMRSLGPVKMEPQHSDQSLLLQQQQQQQQQQFLLSRQPSPATAAQINLLHQQRLLQLQQQHQQQLLKNLPQQRSPLQQQFQPQNLPMRSPVKPMYEPGMCARRLTHYMYQQQQRPKVRFTFSRDSMSLEVELCVI